jgi:hypothetical protein
MSVFVIAVAAALGACGKGKDGNDTADKHAGDDPSAAPPSAPALVTKPVVKIDGPSVTPVITSSITFATTATTSWGEMSAACYRAATALAPGQTIASMIGAKSPALLDALRTASIDPDRDLEAMGAFDCAGSPCMYFAAHLEKPSAMMGIIPAIVPGTTMVERGAGHYVGSVQGVDGTREVHLVVLPIQWPAQTPGDAWSQEETRATHLIVFGGVNGKDTKLDVLGALASGAAAHDRVVSIEKLLPDARARCVIGAIGATDFKPGFQLTGARFALAAPAGKSDPVMQLVGANRTADLEINLALSPTPAKADVDRWISDAHAWVHNIAGPIELQFGGSPMISALADLASIIADKGFKYTIGDSGLLLSWRTDRIAADDVSTLVNRFAAAAGVTP